MVLLNYQIDDELHRRAKLAAVSQGITLKQFLIDALTKAIENYERRRKG